MINSIITLLEALKGDAREASSRVPEDIPNNWVDRKLIHLWEARESFNRKWIMQKFTKELKKKVRELDKKREE